MCKFLENLRKIKIGQRNLKTALAVFLCIVITDLLRIDSRALDITCFSAILCMQDSVENSIIVGKDRILGTFIACFLSIIFLNLVKEFPLLISFKALLISIFIIFIIFFHNLIEKQDAITIACTVFVTITLSGLANTTYIPWYSYPTIDMIDYKSIIHRIVGTIFGIIIAIIVNKYVNFRKLIGKE